MATFLIIGSFAESLIGFRGNLIRDIAAQGHRVFACAPQASAEVRTQLEELGATYRDIYLERTGTNVFRDLRCLRDLVRVMKDIRPDVVLSYTIKPNIYGSLAARAAGVPVISSMITGLGFAFSEGGIRRKLLNRLVRHLFRAGLRCNRVVFFQNPDDWEMFRALGLIGDKNRPTLIGGSGVDLADYAPRPFPSRPSFLLIARLIAEKGIREYVEAARILKRKYPDSRFRLVGGIDQNPSAIGADEIEQWRAEGVVECLGLLDDVRPALADASVYVLPSYYREGVPRTILEAMAMGRPVITTDAPGCRETVIEGSNGFLIPARQVPPLVEAMERFIRDPALAPKMGTQSRALAAEKFDVRKVNHIIMKSLDLLNPRGAPAGQGGVSAPAPGTKSASAGTIHGRIW